MGSFKDLLFQYIEEGYTIEEAQAKIGSLYDKWQDKVRDNEYDPAEFYTEPNDSEDYILGEEYKTPEQFDFSTRESWYKETKEREFNY